MLRPEEPRENLCAADVRTSRELDDSLRRYRMTGHCRWCSEAPETDEEMSKVARARSNALPLRQCDQTTARSQSWAAAAAANEHCTAPVVSTAENATPRSLQSCASRSSTFHEVLACTCEQSALAVRRGLGLLRPWPAAASSVGDGSTRSAAVATWIKIRTSLGLYKSSMHQRNACSDCSE